MRVIFVVPYQKRISEINILNNVNIYKDFRVLRRTVNFQISNEHPAQ